MTQVICIGSVLWDMIGRTRRDMHPGADVPGQIIRLPGGVALNIAMGLQRFGVQAELLSAVGQDKEGDDLLVACRGLGLGTAHVYRSADLPTDRYMAIEDCKGLVAAIADAHSLEKAGDKILTPILNGVFGSAQTPYDGLLALDGNLTAELLAQIARDPAFAAADLRVAPASPGKVERLLPLLAHPRATLYVNAEEAGLLCDAVFDTAVQAAEELAARGAARVLVTMGDQPSAEAHNGQLRTACPPMVKATRITGAGDTFLAAHIAAEACGAGPQAALELAAESAARYVAGEDL